MSQVLVEMDGFSTRHNVIVLAATNRPEVLDPAALRAGRFDRKLEIDAPDLEGREQLFRTLLEKVKLQEKIEVVAPLMAKLTPGFVPADIVNVLNEAALRAAKFNRSSVSQEDLSAAVDRSLMGVGRRKKISQTDLNITAIHEAGHALVCALPETACRGSSVSCVRWRRPLMA
jgi:cell division protease FtsH